MPFDAGTLTALETALADGFEYHRAMDIFIVRSGVPAEVLRTARSRANEAAKNSPRGWTSASKRYVAQELINTLNADGERGDRCLSSLITAVLKHDFAQAQQSARDAVGHIRNRFAEDRQERAERERQQQEESRRRDRDQERDRELAFSKREKTRDALREQFFSLMNEPNPQQRGYALERFLNHFFEFEGLEPRGSFKVVGEQIDGSFIWNTRTHLTEAKWVKEPIAGAEFGAFMYKIDGKTADTRGLYISINGYSSTALSGLKGKGALRFVCVDGAHIVRALTPGQSLRGVLEVIWRHADETGTAYLPVANM